MGSQVLVEIPQQKTQGRKDDSRDHERPENPEGNKPGTRSFDSQINGVRRRMTDIDTSTGPGWLLLSFFFFVTIKDGERTAVSRTLISPSGRRED